MRRILLITSALLFMVHVGIGQKEKRFDPKEREAKMETMKIGYITEKLALTPEEAQRFWPVYNEHHKAMRALRSKTESMNKGEIGSEAEAKTMIESNLQTERVMLTLKEDFADELLQVIPATKVVALFKAEMHFKREVLNHLKKKRMEKGPRSERHN